jgi:hypothetical protein
MSEFLSAAEIREADDHKIQRVEVPEWGGAVHVGTMTAAERDEIETSFTGKNGKVDTRNLRARMAILSCCKPDGTPLFDDSDMAWLREKSAAALDRIFQAAMKINAMSPEDVEEQAKN